MPQPPQVPRHPYLLPTLPDLLLTPLPRLHSLSSRHVSTMSHTHPLSPTRTSINTPQPPTPAQRPLSFSLSHFPTPHSLSSYLSPRLPLHSLSSWGTIPGTKSLHNLWLEISLGETSLLDTLPPTRSLHVISLRILHPRLPMTLLESHQLLSDGSHRTRLRPLSEKLKAGEEGELVLAAERAVREEMGEGLRVRLMMDTYERKVEERDSASYPGLPGCYTVHSVDAVVDGIPEDVDEFVTEEAGEKDDGQEEVITVKKHFWRWVPVETDT